MTVPGDEMHADLEGGCCLPPPAPREAPHHMQLRLTVDRERRIHALASAMPGTPYRSCADVTANFQRLVGLSVGRGFREALRDTLGGTAGCTHMRAPLEAMAAASVQAFASNAHAPRRAGQAEPVRIWRLEALVDTCWSHRSAGPVMQRLQRR